MLAGLGCTLAAWGATQGGGCVAFLTKFDTTGKVTFSTFPGGNNDERSLFGVKLDSPVSVYIAGAYHTTNQGGWDAVVTKNEFEPVATGTGEGQTTPAGVNGMPATTTFPKPLLPVTVIIGGKEVTPEYAGAAPYMVAGVIQINARVPTDIAAGNAEVVIKVGNNTSQGGITLAVK
jgi:hypothetical protein